MFERLDDLYYEFTKTHIGHLWYKFKCWIWYRYSTVKPRYLFHTWIDRDVLLLHCSFEILCKFVEEELYQDIVDWDSDEEHKNAKKNMLELYYWWIECNTKNKDGVYIDYDYEAIYNTLSRLAYQNDNKGDRYYEYLTAISKLDKMHDEFIKNQLKKLIDLMDWMWT